MKTRVAHAALMAAVIALISCSKRGSPISNAERAVAYKLLDPDAAKFRHVRLVETGACGEVNGKNTFGAYVGFRKFVAMNIGGQWQATLQSDDSTEEDGRKCIEFVTRKRSHSEVDGMTFQYACGSIEPAFWAMYLPVCGRH